MAKISINSELCNHCGICVQSCPLILFVQTNKDQIPEFAGDDLCYDCGHCVAICPKDAIRHTVVLPELIIPKIPENKPSYEQIIEMIRSRRSIRAFKDKPVDKENIEKIIQGASLAPSGMNSQSTQFIAISDKDTLNKITHFSYRFLATGIKLLRNPVGKVFMRAVAGREINGVIAYLDEFEIFTKAYADGQDKILHHAPWLLLFHAHVEAPMAEVNAGLSLLNASYVCEGLNLGCFFSGIVLAAAQNDKKIPRLICLPDNHKIYGALVIGHPKFQYKNWIQRRKPAIKWV